MIKLELEVNEVNVILAVLGKHPFEEVANLIVKIKQQGEPQVEAMIAAEQAKQAAEPAQPQAAQPAQPPAATPVAEPAKAPATKEQSQFIKHLNN